MKRKLTALLLALSLCLSLLPMAALAAETEEPAGETATAETLPEPETEATEEVEEPEIPEATEEAEEPEEPEETEEIPEEIPEAEEPEDGEPVVDMAPAPEAETDGDSSMAVLSDAPMAASASGYMNSGDLSRPKPCKAAIWEMLASITSTYDIYAERPSVTAPYAPGALTEAFLDSGLTAMNFMRYLSGLPLVQLDSTMNEDAQYGAVVLAANDVLTHYPSQPADMDEAFYRRGYEATRTSNIQYSYGYAAYTNLNLAVYGFMDDSDPSNFDRVGHRRWMQSPRLLNVGFGFAQSQRGSCYVTLKVLDKSGPEIDYDFISWPSSGYFPIQAFDRETCWSVTLDYQKYQMPQPEDLTVTLTRESDGRTWTLDGSTGIGSSTYTPLLTVAGGDTIIFHPGTRNISGYSGTYTVRVQGLRYRSGEEAPLAYQVEFFDVNASGPEDHAFTEKVYEPTCAEDGYTENVCGGCGASAKGDVIPKTYQHVYSDGEDMTCDVCGQVRSSTVAVTPMYRLYNPNSGEHFYTGDLQERETLRKVGWNYEGLAWNAPTQEGDPVFRLFNPNSKLGDHHYTPSAEERENLVRAGWKFEGVAWLSAPGGEAYVPLYRLYDPNVDSGSHHYTSSSEERRNLVDIGWRYEGVGWYGIQ